MRARVAGDAAVTSETLAEIVRDVWSSFRCPLVHGAPASDAVGLALTGSVAVSGAWNGYVDVTFSPSVARHAAGAMLLSPGDELSEDDVHDAIGELANIVGGAVKSLLPSPTVLSTPEVTLDSARVEDEAVRLVARAVVDVASEPIVADVWTTTTRAQ